MKLKLNLIEEELAFRFQVSVSVVSQTISTWIPFLSLELRCFVTWPDRDRMQQYYPQCFKKYKGIITAIIDCSTDRAAFPQRLERQDILVLQAEIYS